MYNVVIWPTVQQDLLGFSNVLSQFTQQHVDVDMCGLFENQIIT